MFNMKTFFLTTALLGLALADPLTVSKDKGTDCTFCLDRANDCGQPYGGCWNICEVAKQEFQVPGCNGGEGRKEVCEYFRNACGEPYGACYPPEGPIPMIAAPECKGQI